MARILPDRAGIDALKKLIGSRSRTKTFAMASFEDHWCNKKGECGTAYCVAGYATIIVESNPATATRVREKWTAGHDSYHVNDLWRVLDPDGSRRRNAAFADAIFNLWNGVGLNLYRFDVLPLAVRRKAALAVLENFATTGKVDWKAVTPEEGHAGEL